jgi:hypothetical protein
MSYYVYVFPCVYEDYCKLGFTRDPLLRIQSFHSRWYEFFDLQRSLIAAAETERDARDLELRLRRPLAFHRAPAPLSIRSQAGGHTEWLRGVSIRLIQDFVTLGEEGFSIEEDAHVWFKGQMARRADELFEWSSALMGLINLGDNRAIRTMLDRLDGYRSFGLNLAAHLPEDVSEWYAHR